jgi:large subunit ribosomal protein L5
MKNEKKEKTTIVETLMRELHIANPMAVPRLVKIVVACGVGEALSDSKVLAKVSEQLAIITGQIPQQTRAKKAISTFKLRAGDPIGLKVTLRGKRMHDFFKKLTSIALPRVRDFRGIAISGFDGKGNFTLGLTEQVIFPDLDYSVVDKVRGFEVTFVTTAGSDEHAKKLLELLGMPFVKA